MLAIGVCCFIFAIYKMFFGNSSTTLKVLTFFGAIAALLGFGSYYFGKSGNQIQNAQTHEDERLNKISEIDKKNDSLKNENKNLEEENIQTKNEISENKKDTKKKLAELEKDYQDGLNEIFTEYNAKELEAEKAHNAKIDEIQNSSMDADESLLRIQEIAEEVEKNHVSKK